jgi:hypothetical protein
MLSALYNNTQRVKITQIWTIRNHYIVFPMISQVRIEFEENGEIISKIVKPNTLLFYNP